jgi:2-polyprenyl-3-methyl-5-hydroxy-6-metoxy-1,4-benzoquinol methylase
MTNVVCRRCGLVYASPRLTREPLDRFYREWVYPEFLDGSGRFTDRLIASSRVAAAETFGFFSKAAEGGLSGRRLLEVGPGLGDFLVLARDAGATVLGVEMDGLYADFAEHTRGVPIVRKHVEELEKGQTFDVIAMFHVLEHLEDPSSTLRSMQSRLATGGTLFVEVPNFMAPWRMSPTDFFRLEHTYNFSPDTLEALLARAGFEVIARDRHPFLIRVVARVGRPAEPRLNGHFQAVQRHFARWRVRGQLFRPYYALRRLFDPAARRR